MNEMTTTRTPEVVAAEIRTFTASMLNNIIEIGRRMAEVKEMLPHGEFMGWVEENTGYSQSTANNFMRLFAEYGDRQGSLFGAEVNSQTFANLTYSKALALLALPSGEREEFVESHDVSDMTTKELKEAIRERDEAKAAAEKAAADAQAAEESRSKMEADMALLKEQSAWDHETADKLRDRVRELENRPVDVAVQVDEEAVKKAADEARAAADAEWSAKVKEAEDKLAKAREKAKKAAEKAKTAGEDAAKQSAAELDGARQAQANAEAEAERLRAELERAKREQAKASISGDADLALVQEYGGQIAQFVNKLGGMLKKARNNGNEKTAELVRKALADLAEQIGGLAK